MGTLAAGGSWGFLAEIGAPGPLVCETGAFVVDEPRGLDFAGLERSLGVVFEPVRALGCYIINVR